MYLILGDQVETTDDSSIQASLSGREAASARKT